MVAVVAKTDGEAIENPDASAAYESAPALSSEGRSSDHQSVDNGPPGSAQEEDWDSLWVDPRFSSGLMLDPQQLVGTDAVHEALINQDRSSERAIVLSAIMANTVTQVQCSVVLCFVWKILCPCRDSISPTRVVSIAKSIQSQFEECVFCI